MKITHNITQSPGRYTLFTISLQEIVNQKVNILMKRKSDINLNRKCDLSIVWVFKKVMFHLELRNIMKISCLLRFVKCGNLEVAWRFAIVNLNKVAKLPVPSPYLKWIEVQFLVESFSGCSSLWYLRLRGKHYTEMILISDESWSCMLGHA